MAQLFEAFARETYQAVAQTYGFSPDLDDDFATTIEADDPSDMRELEPGDDWDDGAITEPPEEDGGYHGEDNRR